jgi:hypothetical protein
VKAADRPTTLAASAVVPDELRTNDVVAQAESVEEGGKTSLEEADVRVGQQQHFSRGCPGARVHSGGITTIRQLEHTINPGSPDPVELGRIL